MAFSTAITGLKASTTELDVTGNNIANASTVGFKTGRTEFADIFSTVVVGQGSANSAGSGVIVADIAQDFTSGTIQFTNNNLDLAIDGSGFFQLNDGQGGTSYTRAGGFELDKDGNVVSKTGKFLQGFGLDAGGNMLPVGNLAISEKESRPQATTTMALSVNIDDRKDADELVAYDPDKPDSYSFSTTSRVFDSLGNENTIKFDYVEQGSVRERQTIELSPATFAAMSDITLAGQNILLTSSPTTATEVFEELSLPANKAATLAALQQGDDRIVSFSIDKTDVDPDNYKLQITYAASAADVDDINVGLSGAGVTATVKPSEVSASAVQELRLAGLDTTAGGPITLGTAPKSYDLEYVPNASLAVIAKTFKDDQADIKAVFPDIERVEVGKDKNGVEILTIIFKADIEPVDNLAVAGAGATAALTPVETGDNSFKGVYQLYAYLNGTEPLDIGKAPAPGTIGAPPTEPGPIVLKFSSTGLLETVNGDDSAKTLRIEGADPAADPDDPEGNKITLDITGTSQFASVSILNASTQDGYTKGDLIGVNFGSDGTMIASFSNGQNSNLGIVALATFENQSGLQPIGDTAWAATLDSGQPILNPPGAGLNGQLRSASLEQSNVDLSEQLVKLIEAQRNFQANSKTLQTENSITQTILQIS